MPSINLIGGNHLVFAADGNTLSEAVEARFEKQIGPRRIPFTRNCWVDIPRPLCI